MTEVGLSFIRLAFEMEVYRYINKGEFLFVAACLHESFIYSALWFNETVRCINPINPRFNIYNI